jgi:hypothetical protein
VPLHSAPSLSVTLHPLHWVCSVPPHPRRAFGKMPLFSNDELAYLGEFVRRSYVSLCGLTHTLNHEFGGDRTCLQVKDCVDRLRKTNPQPRDVTIDFSAQGKQSGCDGRHPRKRKRGDTCKEDHGEEGGLGGDDRGDEGGLCGDNDGDEGGLGGHGDEGGLGGDVYGDEPGLGGDDHGDEGDDATLVDSAHTCKAAEEVCARCARARVCVYVADSVFSVLRCGSASPPREVRGQRDGERPRPKGGPLVERVISTPWQAASLPFVPCHLDKGACWVAVLRLPCIAARTANPLVSSAPAVYPPMPPSAPSTDHCCGTAIGFPRSP